MKLDTIRIALKGNVQIHEANREHRTVEVEFSGTFDEADNETPETLAAAISAFEQVVRGEFAANLKPFVAQREAIRNALAEKQNDAFAQGRR